MNQAEAIALSCSYQPRSWIERAWASTSTTARAWKKCTPTRHAPTPPRTYESVCLEPAAQGPPRTVFVGAGPVVANPRRMRRISPLEVCSRQEGHSLISRYQLHFRPSCCPRAASLPSASHATRSISSPPSVARGILTMCIMLRAQPLTLTRSSTSPASVRHLRRLSQPGAFWARQRRDGR